MENLGPCYILPDGKILNLVEQGYKTHVKYEVVNKFTTKNRRCLVNLKNYIRINDRLPLEVLAELPIKEPTREQYETLEWFLNDLLDRGYTFIEIGIEPDGSMIKQWTKTVQFYNKFNLLETKPEFVINKIKTHYKQEEIN